MLRRPEGGKAAGGPAEALPADHPGHKVQNLWAHSRPHPAPQARAAKREFRCSPF